MKTISTKPTATNFTMISDSLCSVSIKKISQTEKLYIAYILRFQSNNKTLFASNKSIGEQLGIDGDSVKKLNNKMNKKFDFFNAVQEEKHNNNKVYSSSHTIKVNEYLLQIFLDENSNKKNETQTEYKAPESNITTEVIEEDLEEEIETELEDKEEKYDLFNLVRDYITIDDIDGVDKIKDYMQSSLSSGYFTIKQVKTGLDIIKKDEVVTEELINKLKEAIK
jgi:hypothetical protein